MNVAALIILADIFGWGYFLSWTVSFFPQIYENWRRKCVVGFSFDMWAYFFLSYITYLIYNVTVYFDPKAIMANLDEDNPVKMTDVVFSIVAFACTSFQGIQCLMYDRGSQEINRSTIAISAGCLLALFVLTVLSLFGILGSWFLVLQYCGYVKLVVSFGTYSPQVWLNFKRKSTEGFHIGGVLLDFGGGVLSLLQMDLYCIIEHSNDQLTGNIPKMALAVATLLFNIILIWQHYVFYLGNEHSSSEKEPLLGCQRSNGFYTVNVNAEDGDYLVIKLQDPEEVSTAQPATGSQESLV